MPSQPEQSPEPQPPKKKPKRRGRVARKVKGAGILPGTVMVLILLLLAAAVLWAVFTRLLRDAWPWQPNGLETTTPTPAFQTTQLVLTLVGGIGAAILVVVAYRRQRDLELARFDERFAAAASQLGAGTAAERLAGVYAMAALADSLEIHRQQCIEVLCGYIRLPYDPTDPLLSTIVDETAWPADETGVTKKQTRTSEQLPHDREVRLTIISTITRHLRDDADVSWQGRDFNFTGAVFDGADFSDANFSGGTVDFRRAQFASGVINFNGTNFSGGTVIFHAAVFSNGTVDFRNAAFSAGTVNFGKARFSGGTVDFGNATFSGGLVGFDFAEVSSDGQLGFIGAKFSSGGQLRFTNADFSGGEVSFAGATFSGASVSFWLAKFSGSTVNFVAPFSNDPPYVLGRGPTQFSGGSVDFSDAKFDGGYVSFLARPHPDDVIWKQFNPPVTFAPGVVTRDRHEFRGWPTPEPEKGYNLGEPGDPRSE